MFQRGCNVDNRAPTAVDGGTQTGIEIETQTSPGLLRLGTIPSINLRSPAASNLRTPTVTNDSAAHVSFVGDSRGADPSMGTFNAPASLLWVTSVDDGLVHPGTAQGQKLFLEKSKGLPIEQCFAFTQANGPKIHKY